MRRRCLGNARERFFRDALSDRVIRDLPCPAAAAAAAAAAAVVANFSVRYVATLKKGLDDWRRRTRHATLEM